jgi:hypothetical protein
MRKLVLAGALVSAAHAGGTGTVVANVKTTHKKPRPVKGVSVFLGVTPADGAFEARFGCTNKKGKATFKNVPKDATLMSATGPSTAGGCKNKSFLFGPRPLLTQFYKLNDGLPAFDQFSLGTKSSMKLNFRPRFYPAHELCDRCKFARQFDAKLRKGLNFFYEQGKDGKALKQIKALRRALVRNKGGGFAQDPAEEISGYLKADIDNIKASTGP